MQDEDYNEYLVELEKNLEDAQKQNRKLTNAQLSLYGNPQEDNLVKWQLDLQEEKERIYHLLKGHVLKEDEKGNLYYAEPEDKNSIILNEYGIDYIMNIYEAIVNKNIILSNFEEERINQICFDIGMQIADDIHNDYERMGLDTDDKIKRFCILHKLIMINIEASLRRAENGEERSSLRKVMSVNQTQPIFSRGMQNFPMGGGQPQKKFKVLNPTTWF